MTIPVQLLLASALVTTALVITLGERHLRRRLRAFRPLQVFAYCAAFALVPVNVVAATPGRLPAEVDTLLVVLSVAALAAQAFYTFGVWLPTPATSRPRRVLAIGAHPDDLELAAGGTLAKLADAGHEIHVLVMSDGAVGGDAGVRPEEALRASRHLGATHCHVVGLPDTQLAEHADRMIPAIEGKVRSLNPDIIFTHSRHDQHQDHSAVHWATLRAARRHPAILCYESPSVTTDFDPRVFVDVDGYLDAKASAVALHADQVGKPYMGADKIAAMAVFRGAQAKLDHAEAFEPVRIPAFGGVL